MIITDCSDNFPIICYKQGRIENFELLLKAYNNTKDITMSIEKGKFIRVIGNLVGYKSPIDNAY